jgi:hypothetical protein
VLFGRPKGYLRLVVPGVLSSNTSWLFSIILSPRHRMGCGCPCKYTLLYRYKQTFGELFTHIGGVKNIFLVLFVFVKLCF